MCCLKALLWKNTVSILYCAFMLWVCITYTIILKCEYTVIPKSSKYTRYSDKIKKNNLSCFNASKFRCNQIAKTYSLFITVDKNKLQILIIQTCTFVTMKGSSDSFCLFKNQKCQFPKDLQSNNSLLEMWIWRIQSMTYNLRY